jgi:hypothetical protein
MKDHAFVAKDIVGHAPHGDRKAIGAVTMKSLDITAVTDGVH